MNDSQSSSLVAISSGSYWTTTTGNSSDKSSQGVLGSGIFEEEQQSRDELLKAAEERLKRRMDKKREQQGKVRGGEDELEDGKGVVVDLTMNSSSPLRPSEASSTIDSSTHKQSAAAALPSAGGAGGGGGGHSSPITPLRTPPPAPMHASGSAAAAAAAGSGSASRSGSTDRDRSDDVFKVPALPFASGSGGSKPMTVTGKKRKQPPAAANGMSSDHDEEVEMLASTSSSSSAVAGGTDKKKKQQKKPKRSSESHEEKDTSSTTAKCKGKAKASDDEPAAGSSLSKKEGKQKAKQESGGSASNVFKGSHLTLNRKKRLVTLHQDPYPLEKYTPYVTMMAQFHDWFLELEPGVRVSEIPEEYWALVVMAGHESMSGDAAQLAEEIRAKMRPVADEPADFELTAITDLVPRLFKLCTYGFKASDFARFAGGGGSNVDVPSSLRCTRWEAQDLAMIPQKEANSRALKARDLMVTRIAEREQAREEARQLAQTFSLEDVEHLLGVDLKTAEDVEMADVEEKPLAAASSPAPIAADDVASVGSSSPGKKKAKLPKVETEEQRERRIAREAAKQRKLDAEAKQAKEKDQGAHLMRNFFGVKATSTTAHVEQPAAAASTSTTTLAPRLASEEVEIAPRDFDATFYPFSCAKNVSLAPMDAFRDRREQLGDLTAASDSRSILSTHIARSRTLAAPPRPPSSTSDTPWKLRPLSLTVNQRLQAAQEADDPRAVLAPLGDPRLYPVKVLKFAEDRRPPYRGTWSKPSLTVGPRTPFAIDPAIDYSIDEGLDWEEENLDEEVISAQGEEESEGDEGDEDDDDADSWLAADDEIEMMEGYEAEAPQAKPPTAVVPPAAKKKEPTTKLAAVVFQKGPCWEEKLGEVTWPQFDAYRICLLNDAPAGLDPFTWVSHDKVPTTTATVAPVSTALSPIFPPNKPASAPKAAAVFPSSHLASFLKSIHGSTDHQGELFKQLCVAFKGVTTQACIKATLDQVAERAGARSGAWMVKEHAWKQAGVESPPSSRKDGQLQLKIE